MLLGGNHVMMQDQPIDEYVSDMKENEKINFVREPMPNAQALMGFSAYIVGLITTVYGTNESEAGKIYQKLVDAVLELTPETTEIPKGPYAALPYMERVHKTGFCCGAVLESDDNLCIFYVDEMCADEAIMILKEIVADEIKQGNEPRISLLTDEDWEESDNEEDDQ